MADEERPTSRSTHTSISKLKHESTERRRHTKPTTRSGGQGQKGRATPLIPGKARVTSELEEARAKEGEGRGRFGLDVSKLHSILQGYGEYPAKYRSVKCLSLAWFL